MQFEPAKSEYRGAGDFDSRIFEDSTKSPHSGLVLPACIPVRKDHLTGMNTTTITLSSKGQFALPKKLRAADHLDKSEVFRRARFGPGNYLLEKFCQRSGDHRDLLPSPTRRSSV